MRLDSVLVFISPLVRIPENHTIMFSMMVKNYTEVAI